MAPARPADEVAQWHEVKRAAIATPCSRPAGRSPTTTLSGATTAPGTTRQRPDPFAAALAAAKAAVDPAGVLNPGVLLGP